MDFLKLISVSWVSICAFIAFVFVCVCVYKLISQRRVPVMRRRYLYLAIFQTIGWNCFITYSLANNVITCFFSGKDESWPLETGFGFKSSNGILFIFKSIYFYFSRMSIAFLFTSTILRIWHLLFDIRLGTSSTDQKWMVFLNKDKFDSNWWINNHKKLGNVRWTRKYILPSIFVLFLIIFYIPFLCVSIDDETLEDKRESSLTATYLLIGGSLITTLIVWVFWMAIPQSSLWEEKLFL